jgi:mannose-6-phosphate isomerase-like protein (cupin superfamily)
MSSAGAVVSPPGSGVVLEIGPTRNLVRVAGDDTGGRIGVIEIDVAPGFAGPPLHVHAEIDHVLYVLDGAVAVRIGDQSSVLEAGGCVFVPHGTPHTFGSTGDRPARLLQLDTPRTLDAYFRELTERFPPGAAIDPAAIGEIQRRHDTTPIAN